MRTITLRVAAEPIMISDDVGVRFMDSAPEPLIEISAEDIGGPGRVPLTIPARQWFGLGDLLPGPEPLSVGKLSAGEFLDAMLESDPDEVLLAVSAWLGIHAGRVRG